MHVESWHSRDELAALIRGEKNAGVATRLRAVLLALKGRTNKEIADDLSVSPRSVQSWVERYNAPGSTGGVDALRDRPRPGQPKKLTPQEEHTLVAWLEAGPDLERDGLVAWRGPALVHKINAHFGKKFSLSGAYALLHRLGFEPLRPRPIHRKADPAAQEEFTKTAPLLESLRREKPGQIIEVWLQDEMRFGQKGVLTHGWARRGSRQRAVKQTEYDWAYLFGAVCPRTGESVAMVAPSVSIELMNLHLKWIGEHARAGPGGGAVHVVLMLDRAGWHTSPKVVWPSNITPLFLPPYSPELNGIERLWPRVRVKGLANRALPDGAALDAEGVNAWNRLTIDEIKSTCRAPWLERRC